MAPSDSRSVNHYGQGHLVCKFPINVTVPRDARGHRTVSESSGTNFYIRIELHQVIINLVMNGIASVTDRPRELKMRPQREADAVLVAVQDSGVGIDPAHSDQLLTAFFTTKPSRMGMGLSICRSIIETHGGTPRRSQLKAQLLASLPFAPQIRIEPELALASARLR